MHNRNKLTYSESNVIRQNRISFFMTHKHFTKKYKYDGDGSPLSTCQSIYNLNVWLSQNKCAHIPSLRERERVRELQRVKERERNSWVWSATEMKSYGFIWPPMGKCNCRDRINQLYNQRMQLQFVMVSDGVNEKYPHKKLIKTKMYHAHNDNDFRL